MKPHRSKLGKPIVALMLVLVAVAAMLVIMPVAPASAAPGSTDPDAAKDLAGARRATAKYHDIAVALADGYVQETPCISDPVLGAQGFHYLNLAFLDGVVDPTEPELLMYIPSGNDRLKLVAVEYAVPNTVPIPSLFGQDFHPAPPDVPLFVLHTWLWQANPNGIFEDWNPNLSCP